MDQVLTSFLEQNTHRRPDARLKLSDLMGKFRSTLDGREMRLSPRWRFIKELDAGGYTLGKDGDRVVYVAGLSFQPPRRWAVDDAGRLRLETVAIPSRCHDPWNPLTVRPTESTWREKVLSQKQSLS